MVGNLVAALDVAVVTVEEIPEIVLGVEIGSGRAGEVGVGPGAETVIVVAAAAAAGLEVGASFEVVVLVAEA